MNPTVLFFILFFSVLTRTTLCYVNPNFHACEPQTCGNGPSITSPFRIKDKQDSFCGFPGFDLLCASNGFPMLNLSNTFYIVDEISYRNLSLRVFNPDFLISNSTKCLSPSDNLTLDFRYAVAPNQKEVLLFFDCDLPSLPEEMKQNVLGCSEWNRTRSVLGMAVDDAAKKLKYAKDNCRGGPTTRTVVGNAEGGTREALGRGLSLKPRNWTASKCVACQSSGGRCGFLHGDAFDFRCFCRDRDHHRRCRPEFMLKKHACRGKMLIVPVKHGDGVMELKHGD